jgi:hypothetical protein
MLTADIIKEKQIELIRKTVHCPKCHDRGEVLNKEFKIIPCREC